VVKFGALFSNFTESTNVRVNGIDPAREAAVLPLLPGRVTPRPGAALLKPGQILIPELLARGMKVKVGDTVVVVATNRDGSVNGRSFTVAGVVSDLSGPGGRDAYIDIDDARHILRLATPEISEVLVRLKRLDTLHATVAALRRALPGGTGGLSGFEVHGWDALSPFAHIAQLIDLLTIFVKVILVSIALISIMNVMIMAVYERIREIGTIAAIGTPPGRILGLFVIEGLLLGVTGAVAGILISLGAIAVLNIHKVSFAFGMGHSVVVLTPSLTLANIVTVAAVVIVVAVLASLQPAWKAARMDPISALRHI
jgi:putative ABC transport system permease protein